ncbi:twin-arginine translocase subunit TatC [Pyramidobacter piscolens]|uniref:Sec-independent protein translocase protein TatC n=1 Tax=Pyramidobacter piscolens W5455 TaxID=352165 RepID=A0ABM9ZVC8_9BACT|nr:twin-arginine translocase subunit TatC [Pyramidobacter piscolens]EFB90841.1 twin arginine-targeting protein translocase TatC [Pyramidobacter piscolens W5455]
MEELKKSDVIKHLSALRRLILVSLLLVIVGTVSIYAFAYDFAQNVSLAPLKALNITPVVIGVAEGFMVKLKLSFSLGFFVSLPALIFLLLLFIFPALYRREKLPAIILCVAGTGLFITGVFLSYRYIVGLALRFFLLEQAPGFQVVLSYERYFSFLLNFLWPFGILMELPLVVFILTSLGLLRPAWLRKVRKYVFVISFIAGALLTPPDVVSQVMLAIPIIVFYEISIWISVFTCWLKKPRKKELSAEE